MSACRSSAGKLFHSFGPAAAKHLSPQLLYVRLTTHINQSVNLSLFQEQVHSYTIKDIHRGP